jgi:hypothetical protein
VASLPMSKPQCEPFGCIHSHEAGKKDCAAHIMPLLHVFW